MPDSALPLVGLRVLDASRVLAGPYCGQVLGDLGADVIKIERPGAGDETRAWGPPFAADLSAYFLSCNRNKRSLTLDLGSAEGRHVLRELIGRSDVLIENFRTVSADRLGISPQQLLDVNPQLIVCSISGFGRTGPLADLPGYDFAIQALSGLMSITGPKEGPPCKVGVAVTDVITGLNAAIAILACLRARERTGQGYAIDLALLDCAVAAQVNLAQAFLTSGQVPPRQGNAHFQIVPYQLFRSADGWLVLAVGNDAQWSRFCNAADRADLATDERFRTNVRRVENRAELVTMLERIMLTETLVEWQRRLTEVDVPHAPVWDYAELFASPQGAARGLRVTVRDATGKEVDLVGSPFHFSGAELNPNRSPPRLGEHTDEILAEVLGLRTAQLDLLRRQGVI